MKNKRNPTKKRTQWKNKKKKEEEEEEEEEERKKERTEPRNLMKNKRSPTKNRTQWKKKKKKKKERRKNLANGDSGEERKKNGQKLRLTLIVGSFMYV